MFLGYHCIAIGIITVLFLVWPRARTGLWASASKGAAARCGCPTVIICTISIITIIMMIISSSSSNSIVSIARIVTIIIN